MAPVAKTSYIPHECNAPVDIQHPGRFSDSHRRANDGVDLMTQGSDRDGHEGGSFARHDEGFGRLPDWLDEDRLHEECGVFGVYGHDDAAAITALGLHALQHRGQEGCGIVTYDGRHFNQERRLGLVGDHFSRSDIIDRLTGRMAVGHNRYSTTGKVLLRNVQPLFADLDQGGFAVAHNGNLTNALTVRQDLVRSGSICQSTSDTEIILHLIARSKKRRIVERFIDALLQIEGAYALTCLTNDMLIGARDPMGIRPLVLGQLDGAYVLASETCALDIVGAEFVREIDNGEVVVITDEGIESHRPFPRRPARPCVFEYVYFARPDSLIGGRSVYAMRKQMGAELAAESGVEADVVVPIPELGRSRSHRLRPGSKNPLRARHHSQSLCRPHLHRARAENSPARRQA